MLYLLNGILMNEKRYIGGGCKKRQLVASLNLVVQATD